MTAFRCLIRRGSSVIVGITILSTVAFGGKPKEPIILEKTYDATVDQVYAAAVQAVSSTLKTSVKEACVVNFQTKWERSYYIGSTPFYDHRIIDWTATCKDAGVGKTTVSLSFQINSNQFGDSKAEKKDSDAFWANMDQALKTPAPVPPKASVPPDSGSLTLAQISSHPDGAEINIDGDYAGTTPSQIKLKPGTHSIKITKKGFQPWERSVKVETGESRSIVAELEKAN
jgi:hypothetical protein